MIAGVLGLEALESERMTLSEQEWLAQWGHESLYADDRPHLLYPSVWRWFRAEGIALPMTKIVCPSERARRLHEHEKMWAVV